MYDCLVVKTDVYVFMQRALLLIALGSPYLHPMITSLFVGLALCSYFLQHTIISEEILQHD